MFFFPKAPGVWQKCARRRDSRTCGATLPAMLWWNEASTGPRREASSRPDSSLQEDKDSASWMESVMAWLAPWPIKGVMGCAASPITAVRAPTCAAQQSGSRSKRAPARIVDESVCRMMAWNSGHQEEVSDSANACSSCFGKARIASICPSSAGNVSCHMAPVASKGFMNKRRVPSSRCRLPASQKAGLELAMPLIIPTPRNRRLSESFSFRTAELTPSQPTSKAEDSFRPLLDSTVTPPSDSWNDSTLSENRILVDVNDLAKRLRSVWRGT
mmetsp:Transcript_149634/g.212768  ORF Transcript_149634/g.212768 Transcript_149634/m.212768 type:complete len:272 (+) Transcript_149634:158-973(+)